MQYTSKIALLAVALFGTSALAAPFTGEAEYDVEARDVDNDLSTREFYEMYVEARDLESMDLEAREYLEARQATTVATPQTRLSPKSSNVETHQQTKATTSKKQVFLTDHQKAMRRARMMAVEEFKNDPEYYRYALKDKKSKNHNFAVMEYLSTSKNLKKALRSKRSPYYGMAKRIDHQRKAQTYLADKKNFKKALKNKRNSYYKDAVKMYFTQGTNFEQALTHKNSRFHDAAVQQYLLYTKTRNLAIASKDHPFHDQAVALQKKINKQLRKRKANKA